MELAQKVLYLKDYEQGICHAHRCQAQGLRAWKLSVNLWLCIVRMNGKTIRFISHPSNGWKYIDKEFTRFLLAGV